MDSTARNVLRRTSRAARWLVPAVMTSALIGLAVPSILNAQVPGPNHRAAGAAHAAPASSPPNGPAPQVTTTPTPPPSAAAAEAIQLGNAFTQVAERVLPSVVSIHVEAEAEGDESAGIFSFMIPFMGSEGRGAAPMVRGAGSGVIIREDGVILTNNHVVERARRISVRLRDGRTMRGRTLGIDPAVDLALIEIDAHGLPLARLADSDQARVGEWVLAIGAPLGLDETVTHGVVSATGRAGFGAAEIEDYLQTDASINPGNSGGPLVNLRGEVLGINTMIVGRHTGIGMAVPSRIAQSVVEQILRTGRVTRGWIGVGVQDLTTDLAQTMGTGASHGAVVNTIEPNGPAAHSGLQVGDVVTAVDGHPVASDRDLVRSIIRHGVGDRLSLSVLRNGSAQTIALTTGSRPGAQNGGGATESSSENTNTPRHQGLGLRLATLSPDLAARLGANANAVVVAGVEPGSAADEAGLRRGDVILRADGSPVRNPADVQSAARDRRVTLLVRRGNAQVFVPLVVD